MNHRVSIIIPVKEINPYIRESIPYIHKLDYKNFEILIFPDIKTDESFEGTRIIPTGPMGPADKRDLALKYAEGDILAFLDDDAYPRSDWLSKAMVHFKNPDIAAVGGPAVTPQNDNIWQKASGAVFETILGGGNVSFRYKPANLKFVDDFPSVNLLIRKDVFEKLGGFDSHYWPGEDTKLCLDITKTLKMKILYDPDIFVWHHRRELFIPHLKQIGNYALHRGKFAREFPETSFRLSYFIPSIFLLFVMLGALASAMAYALSIPWILTTYLGIWIFYFILILIDVFRFKSVKLSILVVAGIISTHLWYGSMFILGLMKSQLKQ